MTSSNSRCFPKAVPSNTFILRGRVSTSEFCKDTNIKSITKTLLENGKESGREQAREILFLSCCRTFGPFQNTLRDIWSMPMHLFDSMCSYQLGYRGKKGYHWQNSHNTIIGLIKHDSVFLCINPINKKYQ